ncbi:MAG TPA: ABC transporter permease [Nitrospirota bacterium]|nr:ABC transporter permease [Nitrospirota bacterium]
MKLSAVRSIALVLSRELIITALLLLGVSLVVFIILFLSPGEPFSVLLEGQLSAAAARAGVREAMGVSTSAYAQYLSWLAGMLQGNFGTSVRTGLPVLTEVLHVGGNTLILTIGSLLVTLAIAVPIALYSAVRGMDSISWPLTMFSYVVSALPVFWLGYLVIYFFTHRLGLFPLAFGFSNEAQRFRRLYQLLPILVLGVGNGTISEVIRFLRQEMAGVMAEDYIRTAKAKGASVWKHSFKEGLLIPVTEIVASKIPFILGGAVIVEQVFNWPGIGRMAWQAAQDRDYPVIMGITIIAAVLVRMGSLVQSVVYVAVNPRASKE